MVHGTLQVVGLEGDVALGAGGGLKHALDAVAGEPGLAGLPGGEAQQAGNQLGGLLGILGVAAGHAHVVQADAQHGLDGLLADGGNLIPLLAVDELLLHHPGAAAGHNLIEGEVIHHVLGVDAAGGHPLQIAVGAGQGFQLLHAAVVLGGEELDHVQTHGHGLLHLAAGGGAGQHQRALGQAVTHHVGVEAGGNDELAAGVQGTVQLLVGQHGAGAYQHLGHFLDDGADGVLGGGGAEGDLGGGQAAGHQGLGQRHGLAGVFNGDDGDDTNLGNLAQYFVHVGIPPMEYNEIFR